MNTRTFLKGILSTPIAALASGIIPETNYGFNFIGNGKVKNITEFGNKNLIFSYVIKYNNVHEGDQKISHEYCDYDLYVLMFGHYAKCIEFHKHALELRKNVVYPESFISDAIYDEMVNYDRSDVEAGRGFMPLSEYHKYPTELMDKMNKRLIENRYIVDVYTDFESFKYMLDTKYNGEYTQEVLEDIKKFNF